ncbi:hypothetical protein [Dysgonomonas termitidis]|uniref:Major fimbrial subunit protein N-terminal domain-containing protein n=1 Tax=Dysgonomonas termitidis TaxID=1516126 RepID=A0ABV9KWF3_9BACT
MKTNFKHAIIAATALLLGFSSCSNDDANAPQADDLPKKNVTVSIAVPSTYADEASAVGVVPDIKEAKVFFVGGGVIAQVGTLTTLEVASGKTFNNVPGSVTDVIIVANSETETTSPTLASGSISEIVDYDPLSKLNETLFQQASQTDPQTNVNVFGQAAITGSAGSYVANVMLVPAISRIELLKVEADPLAQIPLTSFKLTGIYINNTYTQLGTDYTTKPISAASILNYGKSDAIWTNGSYPARFKDEFTGVTGTTSFTPANRWAYYVLPVKVSVAGTTIDGVDQSAVPHIVLKIEDAFAVGHSLASPAYITIKDLKVGGTPLTQLAAGKVYTLGVTGTGEGIKIGGENLSPYPETNATESITVNCTVSPWSNQDVVPAF